MVGKLSPTLLDRTHRGAVREGLDGGEVEAFSAELGKIVEHHRQIDGLGDVQEKRENIVLRQREERRRHERDGRQAERLRKAAELNRDLRAQVGNVGDDRERRGEFGDGGERDFAFVRREVRKLARAAEAEHAVDAGGFLKREVRGESSAVERAGGIDGQPLGGIDAAGAKGGRHTSDGLEFRQV